MVVRTVFVSEILESVNEKRLMRKEGRHLPEFSRILKFHLLQLISFFQVCKVLFSCPKVQMHEKRTFLTFYKIE